MQASRTFQLLFLMAAAVLGATVLGTPALAGQSGQADGLRCTTLDIDRAGAAELERYRSSLPLWLEMDDVLFACGSEPDFKPMARRMHRDLQPVDRDALFIVRAAHPGRGAERADVAILASGGPYKIVQALSDTARRDLQRGIWIPHHVSPEHDHDGCQKPRIEPLGRSRVLVRQSANAAKRSGITFAAETTEAVAAVDFDRWFAAVETLAGWNRYTHGDEIAQASAWLESEFAALGLPVEKPTFQVGGTTANNVIATWTGTANPDDWYVVGAHYDSTSQDPFFAAPGAEDNASGCAGVLELARVLVPRRPRSTVIFVCYSGEEQGLFGSDDHAGGLVAAGDAGKLREILTMDMIGYSGDADLDVLLETEPAFASVLDLYVEAASAFTSLRTVESLFAFGSDHVPFLNRNLPALLTIENDWDSYASYHRTTDIAANVSRMMGGQIVQMNAAVLAHRAGVESLGTLFVDGFESADTSAWSVTQP